MYFFGTYPSEKEIARLLDLARLIAQPDYARRVHITLRGPYAKKPSPRSKWLRKPLSDAKLTRPSNFFFEKQNTVFLGVYFLELADVSWKKDFEGGTPHMTIYDGSDRVFAWQVLELLRRFPWKFDLELTPIQILEKKRDYENTFFLELDDIDIAFGYIHEKPLKRDYIKKMHPGQRLFLIEKIVSRVHFLKSASSMPL